MKTGRAAGKARRTDGEKPKYFDVVGEKKVEKMVDMVVNLGPTTKHIKHGPLREPQSINRILADSNG